MNENMTNNTDVNSDKIDSSEQIQNLKELIIGVPPNTAMMRISVLLVKENGETEEQTGSFNFDQILVSRMKYMKLMEMAQGKDGSTGNVSEEGKTTSRSETEEEADSTEEKGKTGEGNSEGEQES